MSYGEGRCGNRLREVPGVRTGGGKYGALASVVLRVFRNVLGVRLEECRGCSRWVELGVLRDDLWGASWGWGVLLDRPDR